jgi:hypothetical protein
MFRFRLISHVLFGHKVHIRMLPIWDFTGFGQANILCLYRQTTVRQRLFVQCAVKVICLDMCKEIHSRTVPALFNRILGQ